jgi:CTP synthase
MKYLFVTGGVMSSLGKGLTAACLGMLLEYRGIKVSLMKFDPYFNVDPGTMSPYQHGEVYVTDDGAETDLDLGHYWRYTHGFIGRESSVSSGQIFQEVILRERRGDYLGQTVQMIPHVTDEIKRRIELCCQKAKADLMIVEIGGTVGDIESLPYMEAIRQFKHENPKDCANLHLTYVPFVKAAGEVKTKPTQQSVQILREIGLVPDLLVCRCETALSEDVKKKIALFCGVAIEGVIDEPDVQASIYEVPLMLQKGKLDQKVCELLCLHPKPELNDHFLNDWAPFLEKVWHPKQTLKMALVGKYVEHKDAYKSILESLNHASLALDAKIEIDFIDAETFDAQKAKILLSGVHGCLIPGGFGSRGFEGKLHAIQYCREHKIPLFGICLGMQAICVEWARNQLKKPQANSQEFDPQTPDPVVILLTDTEAKAFYGGTMRLGAYTMRIDPQSKLSTIYGKLSVHERHRHRYEINPSMTDVLAQSGLKITAVHESSGLCEAVEDPSHPWLVGVQFHPEFGSRVLEPHPLFISFCQAMAHFKVQS